MAEQDENDPLGILKAPSKSDPLGLLTQKKTPLSNGSPNGGTSLPNGLNNFQGSLENTNDALDYAPLKSTTERKKLVLGDKKRSEASASIDNALLNNKSVPFVDRIINGDKYPEFNNGDGSVSSHRMAWGNDDKGYYAFPTLGYEDGKWIENQSDRQAIERGDIVRFKTAKEAEDFADGGWKNSKLNKVKSLNNSSQFEDVSQLNQPSLSYSPLTGGNRQEQLLSDSNNAQALSNSLSEATTAYDTAQGKSASQKIINTSQAPKGVTAGESVLNSIYNAGNQIKGVIPRLNVAAASVWEGILGKELAKSFYGLEGRDPEVARQESYAALDELKDQVKPTIGLTDGGSPVRVAAGVANAITSLGATAAPALASGGATIFTDAWGNSVYDYNTAKAKKLGITTDELYNQGKAEVGVPLAIGTLSGAMEQIGLKGATNLLTKKFSGAASKKAIAMFGEANKEGMTELIQTGLDSFNQAKGAGDSVEDATKKAVGAMTSKQGLEAYLQGLVGSGAAGGIRVMADVVTGSKGKQQIQETADKIEVLSNDLNNPDVTPEAKAVLAEQVAPLISQVAEVVDADEKVSNKLTPEQHQEVDALQTEVTKLDAVINDPNVSDVVKEPLAKQREEIDTKIDDVLKRDTQIIPNKDVKANIKLAVEEIATNRKDDPKQIEVLFSQFKGKKPYTYEQELFDDEINEYFENVINEEDVPPQIKGTFKKLYDKGYIDSIDDNYFVTPEGKAYIDAVQGRLDTRKGVKSGTDMFPTDANIEQATEKPIINEPTITDTQAAQVVPEQTVQETPAEPQAEVVETVDAETTPVVGIDPKTTEETGSSLNLSISEPIDLGEEISKNRKIGIEQVYNELGDKISNIGTPEQYEQYLSTIFPESQIKNVAYHDTDNQFDEFTKTDNGIFTTGKPDWWQRGKHKKVLLLDVKSPLERKGGLNSSRSKESLDQNLENDAVFTTGNSTDIKEGVYVVRNPSQIHTLGSEKDLIGFKNFVEKRNKSTETTETTPKAKETLVEPENKTTSAKNATTDKILAKYGIEMKDYGEKRGKEVVERDADEILNKKDFDANDFVAQIKEKDYRGTDAEQVALAKILTSQETRRSEIDAKIEKEGATMNTKTFDALTDEKNRLLDGIEETAYALKSTGRTASQALGARRFAVRDDYSLGTMIERTRREANNGEKLTPEQLSEVEAKYKDIVKKQKEYETKLAELETENTQLRSEKALERLKREAALEQRRTTRKETKEQLDTEIDDVLVSLRKKAKEQRSTLSANPIPVEFLPDLAKLVKLYTKKGIVDINGVVDELYTQLKNDFDGLTKEHIKQSIADIPEPAISSKDPLAAVKSRLKLETKKITDKTAQQDFRRNDRAKIKLDKEGEELRDALERARYEWEIGLHKQALKNRTPYEKTRDYALEIFNLPRALLASTDLSAPLRQGIVMTASHPIVASKAFVSMLKYAVSQKGFDRWFYELREAPDYKDLKNSKLYIADPHKPELAAKEEQFMSNLAEKIPVIGRLVKGSERAYVGYLNKMRVDIFRNAAEVLHNDGKTYENSPELYKGLAKWVNNATGRGTVFNENAAQVLNLAFFSPRLMASRLNLLNPLWYSKLPKEVRIMALKDMAKFTAVGLTVMALAKLNGGDVEDDPRSSDFGKIKFGNTRYDAWGGFLQYATLISRIMMGGVKNTATGEIQELKTKGGQYEKTYGKVIGTFLRNKLAPVPALGWNFVTGENALGEPFDIQKELPNSFIPLLIQDTYEAVRDEGVAKGIEIGVPASLGVGVQNYEGGEKIKEYKPSAKIKFGEDETYELNEKQQAERQKLNEQFLKENRKELTEEFTEEAKYSKQYLDAKNFTAPKWRLMGNSEEFVRKQLDIIQKNYVAKKLQKAADNYSQGELIDKYYDPDTETLNLPIDKE